MKSLRARKRMGWSLTFRCWPFGEIDDLEFLRCSRRLSASNLVVVGVKVLSSG